MSNTCLRASRVLAPGVLAFGGVPMTEGVTGAVVVATLGLVSGIDAKLMDAIPESEVTDSMSL